MKILVTLAVAIAACLLPVHLTRAESVSNLAVVHRDEAVRISPQGKLYVGERETQLNQLANRLRREGYKPTDTILVAIPDDIPQRALAAVSRELASKGYRRILFSKPPRAIAETENETTP